MHLGLNSVQLWTEEVTFIRVSAIHLTCCHANYFKEVPTESASAHQKQNVLTFSGYFT
jgi:hypothetical protein